MTAEKFTVADYYKKFRCKCGDCRRCCCEGWGVTLSYKEYMRLIGLTCRKSLRAKLDRAFYVLSDATEERYAALNRTYTGECPLRDDDGKCSLQKDMGESVLPEICKMYPRNFMEGGAREGACANSCEETLELMFSSSAPLGFSEETVAVDAADENYIDLCDCDITTQRGAIAILQNRNFTLSERLYKLCVFADNLKNENAETPHYIGDESASLRALYKIADTLSTYSPSFRTYGAPALAAFNSFADGSSRDVENYRRFERKLYDTLPDVDIYLEDLIVNHLFFTKFPACNNGQSAYDLCLAAVGIVSTVKFVAVMLADTVHCVNDFIDIAALLFRCFEHSAAPEIVRVALRDYGLDCPVAAALPTSL